MKERREGESEKREDEEERKVGDDGDNRLYCSFSTLHTLIKPFFFS